MKKIISSTFLIILVGTCTAQFRMDYVSIKVKNIILSDGYRYYSTFQGGNTYSTDTFFCTISEFFDISKSQLIDSEISVYSKDQTPYGYEEKKLDMIIDTNSRKILKLTISTTNKEFSVGLDTSFYWTSNINSLNIDNAPYKILNYGEMQIELEPPFLKQIPSKYPNWLIQGGEESTPHTSTQLLGSGIVKITDSASVTITINGYFPLSVTSLSKDKNNSILINLSLKILTFSTSASNQNQPLSCFDLLGRKHNLEFLGTDGSASTYSMRSLRPGVYFVSDGIEMVKFMIGE